MNKINFVLTHCSNVLMCTFPCQSYLLGRSCCSLKEKLIRSGTMFREMTGPGMGGVAVNQPPHLPPILTAQAPAPRQPIII